MHKSLDKGKIVTLDIIMALMLFAFASSVSPGPNNLMLMSSGANFGFRKTFPHLIGVGLGFVLMLVLVGIGIMQVFDLYPASYIILKWCSVIYLVYLSYKVATAAQPENSNSNNVKPFSFIQAVLFQWVNPKGWTMALTAIGIYAPQRDINSVLFVGIVFGLVMLPSISVWVVLGKKLQKILSSGKRLRIFNGVMATLLLASLYPVLVG
jgi:threonine/homoserine/homoserine lactone efflux protein